MEIASLELTLDKREFSPGETISGRVLVQVEEPIDARRLVIGVHATEERETTDAQGQRLLETRTRYRVERQLDGRRSYASQGYEFQLPLPASRPELEWRVYAFLDIPRQGLKTGADITVA